MLCADHLLFQGCNRRTFGRRASCSLDRSSIHTCHQEDLVHLHEKLLASFSRFCSRHSRCAYLHPSDRVDKEQRLPPGHRWFLAPCCAPTRECWLIQVETRRSCRHVATTQKFLDHQTVLCQYRSQDCSTRESSCLYR